MKCGINGAEHDFNEIPCGINGAVRQASELWIGVNGAVKKVWPLIEVGYQEILDTVGSGEWTCPASGQWEVEGHGGGCGGYQGSSTRGGNGGGGSGEVYTIDLASGQKISYRIGVGGDGAADTAWARPFGGGNTTFGELTFHGASEQAGVGSLASSGNPGSSSAQSFGGAGGKGNKNKPEQTYGNGGRGGRRSFQGYNTYTAGGDGTDGALILTYLG